MTPSGSTSQSRIEAEAPSDLGAAVAQVTEISQRIIQQEIELAKAEISEKATKLAKGAAVGAAAGVFAVFGLIYLLHSLSWGLWKLIDGDGNNYWLGFLITAVIIFVLAAIAGFLAYKFIKGGAPPTPQMAIDEGKKVRATITEKGSR